MVTYRQTLGSDWGVDTVKEQLDDIAMHLRVAATTRLEWKYMHALVECSCPKVSLAKIMSAEQVYAAQFKLQRNELLQSHLKTQRAEVAKKAAAMDKKKKPS